MDFPNKKYNIIYADPPWSYKDKRDKHPRLCGGATVHYNTMSIEDIKQLPINNITEENNLCSIENKRKVADIVGIKDHNTLNNYVKSFKDKGVILKKGTTYRLNSFLEPDTNIVEIEINRI